MEADYQSCAAVAAAECNINQMSDWESMLKRDLRDTIETFSPFNLHRV